MVYEVELKFRLPEMEGILGRLDSLGARRLETKRQEDRYFQHPSRDFRKTDEALRIRLDGERNRLTYKGPKIDSATKTRKEIELVLEDGTGARDQMADLLGELGFRQVRTVAKTRQTFSIEREGIDIEISLDDVEGLGDFIELEALADERLFPGVRDVVLRLAAELELTGGVRRSYLELLEELRP